MFVFLDIDKYCSSFDMLVAIDAFPDSMIFKFENVTGDDAIGSACRIGHDDDCP